MYSNVATVDKDQLLTSVKEELELFNTTEEDWYLEAKIIEAAKEICSLDTIENKCAIIPVFAFKYFPLPCDFIDFITGSSIVFRKGGNPLSYCQPVYQGIQRFSFSWDRSYTGWAYDRENLIYIESNRVMVNPNLELDEVEITYEGVRYIDAEGNLWIPESHARAIVAYACYKFKRRKERPYQDYQREWTMGKRMLVGKAGMLNPYQKKRLTFIMNNLLPGNFRGYIS